MENETLGEVWSIVSHVKKVEKTMWGAHDCRIYALEQHMLVCLSHCALNKVHVQGMHINMESSSTVAQTHACVVTSISL